MLEKIKENMFVVIVALLVAFATCFYVYSDNKYAVDAVTSKGKDVIATVDKKKILADDLYKDKLDGDTLYWQYRTAVINESQKETKKIKKEAKKMANNIEAYYRNQNPNDENSVALKKQLATYGFVGDNAVNEYTVTVKKEAVLNKKYINKHFKELSPQVKNKKGRAVYLIGLQQVNNPKEKNTKKYVDKLIEKDGFIKAAAQYASTLNSLSLTDDTGLYGYMDNGDKDNDFSSSATSIPGEAAKKALKLKKGEATEWVTVTDSNGNTYFVKAYVYQTNLKNMLNSDEDLISDKTITAFINANSTLNSDILEHYSSKLKITYKDKDVKKKIEQYLKEMRKNSEEMEEEK